MNNEHTIDILSQMYQQAKAQFGNALKAYWFNDSDVCPGCGREIDNVNIKGEEAISLNAFIYRQRGVLIGYFLCSRCVEKVFRYAQQNPHQQTPLHTTIEANLIQAYKKHIRSMDA